MPFDTGPAPKSARPSEIIRLQQEIIRDQARIIDVLKGALAMAGVEAAPGYAHELTELTGQERALVGCLYARYPRPVSREAILECVPGRDHARERTLQVVDVLIHKVRAKLGSAAIVTRRGQGFTLGETLQRRLQHGDAHPATAEAQAANITAWAS